MPTAVVDRPHSPVTTSPVITSAVTAVTGTAAAVTSTARTTARVRAAARPAHLPIQRRARDRSAMSIAGLDRPPCAAAPGLFHDQALENEPVASAPARVRRRYAALAAEAAEVCASCPMLSACLFRAVVDYDVAGFLAGTTGRQRQQVRAKLGIQVVPEDIDGLAGVVGGQRTIDHDEVVRLRRANPDESLDRLARRLGCSLSTVKRHLRQERTKPSVPAAPSRPRPTEAEVRRATAEILAENSDSRRAAA